MSWKRVKPQGHYLYNEKWNAEIDAVCLDHLVASKRQGCWLLPQTPPPGALVTAVGDVNARFQVHLTYDDVKERVGKFKKRYETFTGLLKQYGAHWDQVENHVHLSDEWWQLLFRNSPMTTRAYFHHGEPEFNKLAFIFGPTELKDENVVEVINISDTTVVVEEPDTVMLVTSDSEEVSSPTVRRRLFDPDRESSTRRRGGQGFTPRNAFPTLPNTGDGFGEDDANSSCASSDPFKWFDNRFH